MHHRRLGLGLRPAPVARGREGDQSPPGTGSRCPPPLPAMSPNGCGYGSSPAERRRPRRSGLELIGDPSALTRRRRPRPGATRTSQSSHRTEPSRHRRTGRCWRRHAHPEAPASAPDRPEPASPATTPIHSPAPDRQVAHTAVEQPARAGEALWEPRIRRCTHDQPIELGHTPCQPRIGPNILRGARLERSDQRGESVAGRDNATASDSHSPLREQWSSGLGGTGCASWRLDRLESIPWQTVADVLTAGGSPPECAALGLHPPATVSRELRSWADKTRTRTDFEQYRQIARRRDPPPCQGHRSAAWRDQLHQPGAGRARACLPVLARVSPWRRPGCGCSRSCAARCSKPRSYDTPARPTPTSPAASGSWPNIDRRREDLYICSFYTARGTPPHSAVTEYRQRATKTRGAHCADLHDVSTVDGDGPHRLRLHGA
jgi:hypothetical protein